MAIAKDASHKKRRKLLHTILREHFGRQISTIETLGYDSNNYVYHATLKDQATKPLNGHFSLAQHGRIPLPPATNDVVVRISNPYVLMNAAVRVQNEVAAITLMKNALSHLEPSIVPVVYGWNAAADGNGWIVEQYMPGVPLDKAFPTLDPDQQKDIVRQLAKVFKGIQSYELPPTITKYGGLNFDERGEIISGDMTFPWGGPFHMFQDMYLATMGKQLEFSDKSNLVRGWKGTGLRERLEAFYREGMVKVLESFSATRPTLVHGDLDLQNILFDPRTLRITALLDFDFSHIASPADEYFYSFPTLHGLVSGPLESPEMEALRLCQLNGFTSKPSTEGSDVNWVLATTWDEELKNSGVLRPSEMEGIAELAAIYWFLLDVAPPWFELQRWQARNSPEKQEQAKKESEENLDKYMKRWSY